MSRLLFCVSILALMCAHASERPDPELMRLGQEAASAQRTGICNIHRIRMQRKMVSFVFEDFPPGYFQSAYWYEMQRAFPNASESVQIPGVIHKPAKPKKVPRYVCPECKRTEMEWALKHPNDKYARNVSAHR
jgi:hypothetical protein